MRACLLCTYSIVHGRFAHTMLIGLAHRSWTRTSQEVSSAPNSAPPWRNWFVVRWNFALWLALITSLSSKSSILSLDNWSCEFGIILNACAFWFAEPFCSAYIFARKHVRPFYSESLFLLSSVSRRRSRSRTPRTPCSHLTSLPSASLFFPLLFKFCSLAVYRCHGAV